jgi:hypothetical protein
MTEQEEKIYKKQNGYFWSSSVAALLADLNGVRKYRVYHADVR